MKNFAMDLWSDLREKRLWPVAVALIAGLVAVPLVLMKPAEEPAPAAVPSGASAPADATVVALQPLPADLEAAKPLLKTSTLSEFDSKDPFKPLKALESVEDAAGVQTTTTEPGEDTSSGGGGGGGGGSGDDTTTPPAPVEEKKTVYTFELTVNFGTASGIRERKVKRLGILPNERNPLLVFLGVSADDPDEAVFLVDSTVSQAGEGKCKPRVNTCSFLYLRTNDAQNEHIFTDDNGREYTIELLDVKRVRVKASSASLAPEPKGPRAKVGLIRRTASDDEQDSGLPLFDLPLFADEEE